MLRRDFIRRWGRIVLLGGIAGTAGYLTLTGRISVKPECDLVSNCKECRYSGTCRAPKPGIRGSLKGDLKSVTEFISPFGGGGPEPDKILG